MHKPITTIKSFGCSFIFGTELPDCPPNDNMPQASQLTWPALMARQLDFEYRCCARPCAGNLEIMERVWDETELQKSSFFVIGWTFIDRFSYISKKDRHHLNRWNTILPTDSDQRSQVYYKQIHAEYSDKLMNLLYIKTAIDILQQRHIPFIMTVMDDLIFDNRWNTSSVINDLQSLVLPHITFFENKTFLQWSHDNNYKISPAWHPLESAHRAAADYMITVVDKQKTNVPVQPVRV